jgi:hypothetical protein
LTSAEKEVAEELVPFGVGGSAVLFARPGGPALCDEGAVAADGFLGVEFLYPMVVFMSSWSRMSWAMWGGMPLRMASVVKTLLLFALAVCGRVRVAIGLALR